MQKTIAAWCGALGIAVSAPALGERAVAATNSLPTLEHNLFAGQFAGPLSPETRTQLNEMIIRSSLSAYGVELPPDYPDQSRKLLAAVPSHAPAVGHLSSEFGTRHSPFNGSIRLHKGIDIAAPHGSPIYAVADGVVVFAGWQGPLGRVVIVNHGFRIVTKYAHAAALDVQRGSSVRRGDIIGRVGNSGRSTGTHLHFEVRVGGRPIDPKQFMFDFPDYNTGMVASESPRGANERLVEPPETLSEDEAELAVGGDTESLSATNLDGAWQTPVTPSTYALNFGYDGALQRSWARTELPPALLGGYGIGGELDGDEDEPDTDLLITEHASRTMFEHADMAMLPVNFGILLGFSLLAFVLAAGDHLPRWGKRRWRQTRRSH